MTMIMAMTKIVIALPSTVILHEMIMAMTKIVTALPSTITLTI